MPGGGPVSENCPEIASSWPHHAATGRLELKEQQPGGVPNATYRQLTAGGGGYCAMRR